MRNAKCLAVMLAGWCSSAAAQDSMLLPGVQPEVILTCMADGKPASFCNFGCANVLGVVGKTSTSGFGVDFASRVEMYLRSAPGRDDEHIWVAYRYKPFNSPAQPDLTGYALVASSFTCQWGDKSGDPSAARWKIERFDQ